MEGKQASGLWRAAQDGGGSGGGRHSKPAAGAGLAPEQLGGQLWVGTQRLAAAQLQGCQPELVHIADLAKEDW